MEELAMPSKVFNKSYIQMPEEHGEGMWILNHPHADLAFVDSAWIALQQLLGDGTLIRLKASTAGMARVGATILCFTRPVKREVKRAAKAIRRVVDFRGIMYYKLKETTSRGLAEEFGDTRCSFRMHTFCGGFYLKKNGTWIQDNEDPEKSSILISNKFYKINYSGYEDLLSTHQERCFWNLPEDHQCSLGCGWWSLFCSCKDESPYLSEADRVWVVAKKLLEDGLFVGITLKKAEGAQRAEVRFYVSPDCVAHSRLAACDFIFSEASSRTVMFFVKTEERNLRGCEVPSRHFLMYTSGGELYEKTEYSDVYLSGYGNSDS